MWQKSFGPTDSCWKNSLVHRASKNHPSIIPAPMQVYRHTDIGSVKVMPEESGRRQTLSIWRIEPELLICVVKFVSVRRYLEETAGKPRSLQAGTADLLFCALSMILDLYRAVRMMRHNRELETACGGRCAHYLQHAAWSRSGVRISFMPHTHIKRTCALNFYHLFRKWFRTQGKEREKNIPLPFCHILYYGWYITSLSANIDNGLTKIEQWTCRMKWN